MRVHAAELVAAALRLQTVAEQLAAADVTVHPPLAADQTSDAAAARLSAAAETLHSAAAAQSAALRATADQLASVAARFSEQEILNADAIEKLGSSGGPVEPPGSLAPVPSMPTDARLPLPPPAAVDGELVARQLWAGSASAGAVFEQRWRTQSVTASATAAVIRDVASALPDMWDGPAGADAVSARLRRQATEIEELAARAGALADQATDHARSFSAAVAAMPSPTEFEAVRDQLRRAVDANNRSGGRYSPLVSSLVAQQGALQQKALNAHAQYHAETETSTRPDQAGQLAGQLPGLLGAIGGMLGGAVAAVTQLPQALMQTGQQLAQTATQGLSGLATPHASGIDSPATQLSPVRTAPHDTAAPGTVGATTAAGATDMPPVSPSTSSAPPQTTPMAHGAPPIPAAPAAGQAALPFGMPLGALGSPGATDAGKPVPADRKLVVPIPPHTESVTGKVTAVRLPAAVPAKADQRA